MVDIYTIKCLTIFKAKVEDPSSNCACRNLGIRLLVLTSGGGMTMAFNVSLSTIAAANLDGFKP